MLPLLLASCICYTWINNVTDCQTESFRVHKPANQSCEFVCMKKNAYADEREAILACMREN